LGTRVLQLVGAGGVGYYGREYVPKEWTDRLEWLSFLKPSGDGATTGELTKVLSQLGSKIDTLGRNASSSSNATSPQTIVVRDSNGSNGASRVVTIVLVAGAFYAYLRFWKGLRFDDLKLATQGSLKDAMSHFKGSMDSMQSVVSKVKEALTERIEKVKETIQRVRDEVSNVHDDVRDVKQEVDATRSLAESCDRRLEETSAKQDYANRGIHALCAVVGELLHNATRTPAIENLRHFTHIGRPAELEGNNNSAAGAIGPSSSNNGGLANNGPSSSGNGPSAIGPSSSDTPDNFDYPRDSTMTC